MREGIIHIYIYILVSLVARRLFRSAIIIYFALDAIRVWADSRQISHHRTETLARDEEEIIIDESVCGCALHHHILDVFPKIRIKQRLILSHTHCNLVFSFSYTLRAYMQHAARFDIMT